MFMKYIVPPLSLCIIIGETLTGIKPVSTVLCVFIAPFIILNNTQNILPFELLLCIWILLKYCFVLTIYIMCIIKIELRNCIINQWSVVRMV